MGSTTVLEDLKERGSLNTDSVKSKSCPLQCGEQLTFNRKGLKARVGTPGSSLKQLDFNPKAEGKENLDQLLPSVPFYVQDFIVHAEIGYAASSCYPQSVSAYLTDTHEQILSSLIALVPS